MTGVFAASKIRSNKPVIGHNGVMPWFCRNDLRWFKFITLNETVVMGRKTMESMDSLPLPDRTNIVVSRTLETPPNGFDVVRKITDVPINSYVVGGADLLNQLMDKFDSIYVTEILKAYCGNICLESFLGKFRIKNIVKVFDDCVIWKMEK